LLTTSRIDPEPSCPGPSRRDLHVHIVVAYTSNKKASQGRAHSFSLRGKLRHEEFEGGAPMGCKGNAYGKRVTGRSPLEADIILFQRLILSKVIT